MSSSNRNYTQYDPEATKSKYYQYALEAMSAIDQRCPLGGINRVDVVEELKLPQQEVLNKLKTCSAWGKERNNNHSPNILADLLQNLRGANCNILTNYALGYMQPRHLDVSFETGFLGTNHNQLVIGRPKNSGPANISTWNEDALICDVWAKEIYLAVNFYNVRIIAKDIEFYGLDLWNNRNSYLNANQYNKIHYLDGTPDVIVGYASAEIDRALVAMVKLDEKRQAQLISRAEENKKDDVFLLKSRVPLPFGYGSSMYPTLFADVTEEVAIFDINNRQHKYNPYNLNVDMKDSTELEAALVKVYKAYHAI